MSFILAPERRIRGEYGYIGHRRRESHQKKNNYFLFNLVSKLGIWEYNPFSIYYFCSCSPNGDFPKNIPSENADTSNEKEGTLIGPLALSLWENYSVSKLNLKDKMMRKNMLQHS